MKKETILILAYTVAVAGLVLSVKAVQTFMALHETAPKTLLADCDDPPPTTAPGE